MSNSFILACHAGDEKKARELYDSDKSVLNSQDDEGITGLPVAFLKENHSICRWLLSLADIDVNLTCYDNFSALHVAATRNTPLDLVIALTRLASKEIINLKQTDDGVTALDVAVGFNKLSTAIYLSWLGAQCMDKNKKFDDVTLQTWLDAGCQQDAPMWAVAAKDLKALRQLAKMEEVIFNKPKLLNLAKLFGYQEIKCFLENNSNLKIYSNQLFCDFEVTLKEKTFPCHKIFLVNYSEPFQALIGEKMRENLPMKTELANCPNETVAESFIKYFYIGVIDEDILNWHIVSFFHLSDYYRVKEMHTLVENAMIAQLCKENVKEFMIAADKYQGDRLKAAAFEFLRENRGIWAEDIEEWKPYISRELLCQIVIQTG